MASVTFHAVEIVPGEPPAIRVHLSDWSADRAAVKGAEVYDARGNRLGPPRKNADSEDELRRVGGAVSRALRESLAELPTDPRSVADWVEALAEFVSRQTLPLEPDGDDAMSLGCHICHTMGWWPRHCRKCPRR